jgi:hypothetical protein
MVRYMERIMGIDMDQIQEEIVPASNRRAIKRMGNGSYPIGEHRVVVKGGRVVTVKNHKQKGRHK